MSAVEELRQRLAAEAEWDEAPDTWDLYEDEPDEGDEPDICPECGAHAFLDEGWYICPECGLGWNSEPPF